MRRFFPRFTVLGLLLLFGCGGVEDLKMDLDGKRDATFEFWTKLQGIQYRGHDEIKRLNQNNLAAARSSDLEKTAQGFSKLSSAYGNMAQRLAKLDGENVDEMATNYRDRLVSHLEAVRGEFQILAEATKNREISKVLKYKENLRIKLTAYVDLWKKRNSVMSKLSQNYGGADFDYQN